MPGMAGQSWKPSLMRNFFVTVAVPAGYSGSLKVLFESPWYWRAAEAVTAVTLLAMCIQAYVLHRKKQTGVLTGGTGEEEKVKKKKEWLFVAGIFLLASYPAFSRGWQGGLDSGDFLHVLNQTGERGVFLYRLLVVLIHLATAAASYWKLL